MDHRYANGWFGQLPRKPSEYVRSANIYVACEADEDIPYTLRCIGDDRLVMASDFPHGDDTQQENMAKALTDRGDLSAELVEKILMPPPSPSLQPLALANAYSSRWRTRRPCSGLPQRRAQGK